MEFIKNLYGKLREAWPPNRVVTALGPIVFVPLAGLVAVEAAQWGLPPIDPGFLAGIFAAGALAAITALRKFLDGWIAYEAQLADPMKQPVLAKVHQDPPPTPKEGGGVVLAGDSTRGEVHDGDQLMSLPSDIDESDAYDETDYEAEPRG